MNVSDEQWNSLLQIAVNQRLVPFLGAGASASVLPTGDELAKQLIETGDIEYPSTVGRDLTRVAEYYRVMSDDPDRGKKVIADMLKAGSPRGLDSPPHRALAHLPVPLYLTTNYDDLMEQELIAAAKLPITLYPLWHPGLKPASEHALGTDKYETLYPTAERPVVYHLHGHWDVPESMVVAESDYIQFLLAIQNPELLPAMCRQALVESHLLFVGYSLRDWNIRMLLQGRRVPGRGSWAILPSRDELLLNRFLERELDLMGVKTLWCNAEEFTGEFLRRWKAIR